MEILTEMIALAEAQKAQNFNHLYSLKIGLEELTILVRNNEIPDISFVKKWNNIMVWVYRAFEDHPILSLIYDIDNEVVGSGKK